VKGFDISPQRHTLMKHDYLLLLLYSTNILLIMVKSKLCTYLHLAPSLWKGWWADLA